MKFHTSCNFLQGLRNDLKAALDKIDQQYLNELVGGQEPGEEDTQNDLKVHEENTTIEELEVIPYHLPHSPTPPFIPWSRWLSSLDCSVHSTLASLVVTKALLLFHACCLFTPFFPHFLHTFSSFLPSKVFILICLMYILLFIDCLVKPVMFYMHVLRYI